MIWTLLVFGNFVNGSFLKFIQNKCYFFEKSSYSVTDFQESSIVKLPLFRKWVEQGVKSIRTEKLFLVEPVSLRLHSADVFIVSSPFCFAAFCFYYLAWLNASYSCSRVLLPLFFIYLSSVLFPFRSFPFR